jgi:hypothetical protein
MHTDLHFMNLSTCNSHLALAASTFARSMRAATR